MPGSGAAAPFLGALRSRSLLTGPLRRARLDARFLAVAVALLLVAGGAAAVLLSGLRLFVVETPSMGTAAPVGTLVVDAPVRLGELAVGDVISYHPPGVIGTTYTHRVVRIAGGLVRTRGDINGAADPWSIGGAEIVGRAVLLLPGVGWIVKALPLLLVGSGVLWMVTLPARAPTMRAALRVLGGTVLGSAAIVVLKPLASIDVLTTAKVDGGTAVTVVSTGLLPVSVHFDHGGAAVRLSTGEVGRLLLDHATATGAYRLLATVAPDPLQWALLGLVCGLPMLWVLVVGLPAEEAVVGP